MFCLKCGNEIKENMMFCNKCGTPVDKSIKERISDPPQDGNKKQRSRYMLITVVILAVIAVVFIFFGRGSQSEKETSTDSNEKDVEDAYSMIIGDWSGSGGKLSITQDGINYTKSPPGWGEFSPTSRGSLEVANNHGIYTFTDHNQSIRLQMVPDESSKVMDLLLYLDEGDCIVETYDPGHWQVIGELVRE